MKGAMSNIELFLKRISFTCLGGIAILFMLASIAEKFYGTYLITKYIYVSRATVALWMLLALSALGYLVVRRAYKNISLFLLHLSLLVILSGAFITHVWGIGGRVYLHRDAPPTTVFILDDGNIHRSPFALSLNSFCVERHKTTNQPMDYVSSITIADKGCTTTGVVSMNNVYRYSGWQFCQMHYDDDENGTTLRVSHDPWGVGVTYGGYLLLFFSFLTMLVKSKWRDSNLSGGSFARGLLLAALFLLSLCCAPYLSSAANLWSETADSLHLYVKEIYEALPHVRYAAVACLLTGCFALVACCCNVSAASSFSAVLRLFMRCVAVTVIIFLLALLLMRGFVGAYIPLANGFEVMLFMAICSLCFVFQGRGGFTLGGAFGFLIAGFSLLVAGMGNAAAITPLAPVLYSPILSVHVSVIMCAYSLFAFMMLNGVVALVLRGIGGSERQIIYMAGVSRMLLCPALFLLVTGVFAGAVWANISWGRYWGWDPKEVWALITVIVYSFPVHAASLQRFRSPLFLHLFFVLSFLSVLFTYFGVNYILGGLHSYVA